MKSFLLSLIVPFFVWSAVATPARASAAPTDLIWTTSASVGAVDMKAKYKESPENGLIDQTVEVSIEHAPPHLSLKISANGRPIGSMTTNAFGVGRFRADIFGVLPDANGRPSGPRLETGDVIRVYRGTQGLQGALQLLP